MSLPRILVTGAGGFIGGWMVEALHLAGARELRAGVSRWATCARIARFPVDIVPCNFLDQNSLDSAMSGVDVVVHCARAKGDESLSVEGTRLLLERAKAAGVKRVIYLSSAAVYGEALGEVSEDTAAVPPYGVYAEGKRRAEEACRAAADKSLTVVVLRPTLVYGPFSDTWTMPYIGRLLSGKWGLLGPAAQGRANLIYIGDLVRFAQHLMTADLPEYSVFNANGLEVPTWDEYFARFASALGAPPLQPIRDSVKAQAMIRRPVRAAGKYMLKNHRPLLIKTSNQFLFVKDLLKRAEEDLRLKPNDDELRLYSMDVVYTMDRAAQAGFRPQTTLTEGLAFCAEWARGVGLAA